MEITNTDIKWIRKLFEAKPNATAKDLLHLIETENRTDMRGDISSIMRNEIEHIKRGRATTNIMKYLPSPKDESDEDLKARIRLTKDRYENGTDFPYFCQVFSDDTQAEEIYAFCIFPDEPEDESYESVEREAVGRVRHIIAQWDDAWKPKTI